MSLGGLNQVNVDDLDVQRVSTFALKQINAQTNSNFELVEISKAWVQVVAGLKYIVELKLSNHRGVRAEILEPPGASNGQYRLLHWQPL